MRRFTRIPCVRRGWVALAFVLVASAAAAHVSITPRQSQQGATEKYVVRIPTEENVTTVSAELDVPEGVIVETLQQPAGWTYDVKRADDRIVSIVWNAAESFRPSAAVKPTLLELRRAGPSNDFHVVLTLYRRCLES